MVRVVVDATEIIRYVESGLTGHLNDAQTLGFYALELCLPEQCGFVCVCFFFLGGGGR